MTRFASSFAIFLCAGMLAGCASGKDSSLFGGLAPDKVAPSSDEAPPADLESGIRQAQLERLAGHYDKAVHILSQLMLVASDDPRVIGEYGKSLAEQGRGQEAVQFLGRASELQPKDWTIFSALGVAYDEVGQEDMARKAYERALALKPAESSVLNNYALSRMMANDPVQARQLMAEAEKAGGGADPKIARNIALVKSLVADLPAAPKAQAAASVTVAPMPALAAPRPLQPETSKPVTPAPQVVMEPVPADPLAGPVKPRPAVPKAKPAAPAAKAEAAPAAKQQIPGLRETASVY